MAESATVPQYLQVGYLREKSGLSTNGGYGVADLTHDTVHTIIAFDSSAIDLKVFLQTFGIFSYAIGPTMYKESNHKYLICLCL